MIFEITIPGMVQGIGFRPFVAETAEEMGISGTVCNSGGIVTITCEVEKTEVLEEFTKRLRFSHPQGAKVSDIRVREQDPEKGCRISDHSCQPCSFHYKRPNPEFSPHPRPE